MIRCNQIAMFLDVNLPLIVTAKTSAPDLEQFERPPFWKPCRGLGRIARRHCVREAQISRRQHYQTRKDSGRGCANRSPRDFKSGIRFHRLPLKNKPFLKEWLVRIKRANLPKLSQCHVCSELFESVSKVAVTSIPGPAENVNARRLASERRLIKLFTKR